MTTNTLTKRVLLAAMVVLLAVALAAVVVVRSRATHSFTFPVQIVTAQSASADFAPAEVAADREDWPQWRGVNRDGIAGSTGLLRQWPAAGPPLRWTTSGLGQGMSGVAVARGLILTLGKRNGKVWLACRTADDGAHRWATEIGAGDEPNGTPTVAGDRVFAVTREGRMVCAQLETGQIVWTRDFVGEFGGHIPTWGYSESPLVDEGRVICTPGADDALLVALAGTTGETIWTTPIAEQLRGKGHSGAGYSSAVVSHAAGVKQYVQMLGCGAVGVAAADGALLWAYSRVANSVAVIPTPIVQGDHVFVSSGYGAGAALLKLARTATGLEPQEVYFHRGNEVQNHHGGMILVDGLVYMGHGHNQGLPLCMDLLSGEIKWGPVRGPGSGSAAVAFADGQLYFRFEDARMALVEATATGYQLKSEFELPSNLGKSWPHPVIAHNRLYLRDQDVLMCYELTD